ncbi:MAG: protein kinase [Acidobacteriia bacterium]|nr:protein kinase [Terriglobia bacterium]
MSSRIGKYEILSEIGHGDFGRVYRAYDPQMRRNVAIKVLIADTDPELLARFHAEAAAAGNLRHKNIVTVYEYSTYEGKPYIVMELVEGESLQQILSRHAQFPILQKVRFLSQAAEGLACAHENRIVHRDIKPANIMIQPHGEVKLMDFGIALVSGQNETRRTRQGDLIGTILYMSPERIHGMDADPCADIFAFGVVCYEFLTGKHPFEAKDYGAVFYNITSVEPPPLRQVAEDCPENLELLVQRALAKDRDTRYQSMEELLFDLKPVELELSQREAALLLERVKALSQSGEIAKAQENIREVLRLDPGNREARRLLDGLIEGQRKQAVRKRVDTLLRDGREQLGQRQFTKAIQFFESALRLDSSDPSVRDWLARAKDGLEANRRAGRLLSEARREMLAGELEAALRYAEEARAADAENRDAAVLSERLRQQIEEQNKALLVEDAFNRLEELLLRKEFGKARAVLAEVEQDADKDIIADLRSRLASEEAEEERRTRDRRMQERMAKARQQLQANQLAEAGETLRTILDEFPDSTAPKQLWTMLQEQIAAQQRADAIADVSQEALRLIQEQRYTEARQRLAKGLEAHPRAAALERLLDRAAALDNARERASAIDRVSQQAQELRVAGRIEEALSLVSAALNEMGRDAGLMDLRRQLEFEREQQQYAAGVERALAEGRTLLDAGRFAEALAVLEGAAMDYPGEPKLGAQLNAARQAKLDDEEQRYVADITTQARELTSRQNWEQALECVDAAFQRYPYNTSLFDLLARTRENWREHKRRDDLGKRCAAINQALSVGDWTRAGTLLRAARHDFPSEPELDQLDRKLREAQLEAQLRSLEEEIKSDFASDDLERAARHLAANQALAGQPRWQALDGELERRRAYQYSLWRAREFEERGDLANAAAVLDALVKEGAADDEPARSLARIRGAIRAKERDAALGREIQEADEQIRKHNFTEVARIADQMAREFPGHKLVTGLRARLENARQRWERERVYGETLAEAERKRAAGEYDRATELLANAMRDAPDARATVLLETVVAERKAKERKITLAEGKDRARELLRNGQFAAASAAAAELANEFGADAELTELQDRAERESVAAQALSEIRNLEQQGALEAALDRAEAAARNWAGDQKIWAVAERLRQAVRDKFFGRVRALLDTNDARQALDVLHAGEARWRNEPLWQELAADSRKLVEREEQLRQAQHHYEQGLYDEAERTLRALVDLDTDPRAIALVEAIAGARERTQKEEAIRQGRQQIQVLATQGNLEAALGIAQALSRRYPGEAQLARDRDLLAKSAEADFVNRALARLATLQNEQQWDRALEEGNEALARYPVNRELLAAIEQLRESAARERRRIQLAAAVQRVRDAIQAGNFQSAGPRLTQAAEQFPNEAILEQLRKELAYALRQRALETLGEAVTQLFSQGKLEEAAQQLEDRKKEFAAESLWQQLSRELETRRAYEQLLKQAQERRRNAQFEQAEGLLRAAIAKGLPDTRAAVLLQAVVTERLEKARREEIRRAMQESDRLIGAGKLSEALGVLDRICGEYPNEATLNERRKALETRVAQERQLAETLQNLEAAVRPRLEKWDLDEAARHLACCEPKLSEDARWKALDADLKRRRSYLELLAEAERFSIAGEQTAAQEKLQSALAIGLEDTRAQMLLDEITAGKKSRVRPHRTVDQHRWRRPRPLWLAAAVLGMAAAAAIVWYLLLAKPPGQAKAISQPIISEPAISQPKITVKAAPLELYFSYRLGDSLPLPTQRVRLEPPNVAFDVKRDDDWVRVTRIKGGGLQVGIDVNKIGQGKFTTGVQLTAREPVSNPAITIRVHLEVEGKPPLTPIPIQIAPPGPVTFEYTIGGTASPSEQSVEIVQGEIGEIRRPTTFPLEVQRRGKTITLSVSPQGVSEGPHEGVVLVKSSDSRVDPYELRVLLSVHPKVEEKPKPKEQKQPDQEDTRITSPSPPPTGSGCSSGTYTGDPYDTVEWQGKLDPGASLVIKDTTLGLTGGRLPPPDHPIIITMQTPGRSDLDVQAPELANKCAPLWVTNKMTKPITYISISWRQDEKAGLTAKPQMN